MRFCFAFNCKFYWNKVITICGIIGLCNSLEAVHKRRLHKIAKKLTPPPLFVNVRTGSIPLVRANHHKFLKNPMIFAPKSADVHIWRTPPPPLSEMSALDKPPSPWLRTSFMDGPLGKVLLLIESCLLQTYCT